MVVILDVLLFCLVEVDEVVIGLLMYNLGVFFIFKVWIDRLVCVGKLFKYMEIGLVGLIVDKFVMVFVVCGGVYVGIDYDM